MSENLVNICDRLLSEVPMFDQIAIKKILYEFITGAISYQEAKDQTLKILPTADIIDKLSSLLTVDNHPIPEGRKHDLAEKGKKIKSWSSIEDQRLLAGIHKYGCDDWSNISRFVGAGRTRGQCSQRWLRSLNPLINKNPWTQEEDIKLMDTVNNIGDHSWTKVASILVGRTDVQCRYRYQLIAKKYPADLGITLNDVITKFYTPQKHCSMENLAPSPPKKKEEDDTQVCKVKANNIPQMPQIPFLDFITEAGNDANSIFNLWD